MQIYIEENTSLQYNTAIHYMKKIQHEQTKQLANTAGGWEVGMARLKPGVK